MSLAWVLRALAMTGIGTEPTADGECSDWYNEDVSRHTNHSIYDVGMEYTCG